MVFRRATGGHNNLLTDQRWMTACTHSEEKARVWCQKDFVRASYQHLKGAASACSACSSPSLNLSLPRCRHGGNIPRPPHRRAGIWLNSVTQRLRSASKNHTNFRQKKKKPKPQGSRDTRSFALAGLWPIQKAKTTHSTSQGSLRQLLSLLKGCWWSALPVRAAKCFHSTPNLAPKPGLVRRKEEVSENGRFLSTIPGENSIFGTFSCCFSAQGTG